MTSEFDLAATRRVNPWRLAAWSLAGLLLILPMLAMRFSAEVNWTTGDFLLAGLLLGGTGLILELAVWRSRDLVYRAAAGMALAAAFLILWANAAVGMIGDEDNRYNLLFLAPIAIALLGTIASRMRAAGMARTMLAAAAAHLAIALGGLPADRHGALISAGLAALWLISAGLFRAAASRRSSGDEDRGGRA
ncbi:hypothetical protein [Sphingosinicella sp. BN140058]|uniref:hypothetical protein n=1 Tax=Sphingosinicella sp. BN140058 TaxID=1892855 RepID=UPI0010132FD2|nr:hypothetical protein [Sphingosinicella sp. BN140058]QAY76003.1 hypothetical protein ETR14_05280 [Sphingosinicella sp. BN140058]